LREVLFAVEGLVSMKREKGGVEYLLVRYVGREGQVPHNQIAAGRFYHHHRRCLRIRRRQKPGLCLRGHCQQERRPLQWLQDEVHVFWFSWVLYLKRWLASGNTSDVVNSTFRGIVVFCSLWRVEGLVWAFASRQGIAILAL
jgi:hypothetical protein